MVKEKENTNLEKTINNNHSIDSFSTWDISFQTSFTPNDSESIHNSSISTPIHKGTSIFLETSPIPRNLKTPSISLNNTTQATLIIQSPIFASEDLIINSDR